MMTTFSPPSMWDKNIPPEQDDMDAAYIPKAYPPAPSPTPYWFLDKQYNSTAHPAEDYMDPTEDELEFTFGKHRGRFPSEVLKIDLGYIVWVYMNVDANKWFFPEDFYQQAKRKLGA